MRFSDRYGFYELNEFPGCNQIVVSNHAFIYEQYRGQGHGQAQHFQRLNKARELGYNRIICTVRRDNLAERHILLKNGWGMDFTFTNTETGHDVQMWSRRL
jgi:RimJ/RimL family protein N-acetyltransferase